MAPTVLLADGSDRTLLTIATASGATPRLTVQNATLDGLTPAGPRGHWQAHLRSTVNPGAIRVRVEVPDAPASSIELAATLDARDPAEDGTPGFLRLDDEHDREAFRRWFTFLAETQYFQAPAARPPEISDCAALLRYAYREALHAHDAAWVATARLPLVPAFDSVAKYRYPSTPLGAALFRARPGPFVPADLTGDAFLQFADARTLWRSNTHAAGRDLARALPGDLLFYHQDAGTWHGMVYLGPSHIRPDGRRYVVYHTGPDAASPGEIRRLSVEELLHFPRPEWRPVAANPNFLGVARWNILRKDIDAHGE